MFVGFTKRLKAMSGFRLGFGMRVNKRNWWYFLIAMSVVGMFYLMWYSLILGGWATYYIVYGTYKFFYYIVKWTVMGCKKLYSFVGSKVKEVQTKSALDK